MRVMVFLDVDGPLIPFGGVYSSYSGEATVRAVQESSNPLLARVDPSLGSLLLALECELVWATTWMDDANRYLAPILGLPALDVMEWPEAPEDPGRGVHWKTPALVERAAGQPFIWLDDEINETDRRWVSTHHNGPALLHRIDPRIGLTPADFTTITTWLA